MNPSSSVFGPRPAVVSQGVAKVGDILVSEWGYEQINVDFYQVTAVTGASVRIVQLEGKEVPSDSHGMFGTVTPVLGFSRGVAVLKKVKAYGSSYAIKISSYASAYVWDGKPVNCSHTH